MAGIVAPNAMLLLAKAILRDGFNCDRHKSDLRNGALCRAVATRSLVVIHNKYASLALPTLQWNFLDQVSDEVHLKSRDNLRVPD